MASNLNYLSTDLSNGHHKVVIHFNLQVPLEKEQSYKLVKKDFQEVKLSACTICLHQETLTGNVCFKSAV